jgi:hypothetical protein
VRCDSGVAAGLSFGRVAGVKNPRLILIPYITYGVSNPRVLMSGPESKPVFTSVWWDWYRTNASEPYYEREPKPMADGAAINGGLRYIAKTDGRRKISTSGSSSPCRRSTKRRRQSPTCRRSGSRRRR